MFSIYKAKKQYLKALSLSLFMSGCASTASISLDKVYKKEAEMYVDTVPSRGIYVAPRQKVYKLKFELPDKPNIVKITTCHRDETYKDTGKRLEFDYTPVEGLEDNGSCLLEMAAFDDQGYNVWGLIDFEDTEKLRAKIGCNGKSYPSRGASICQSKTGLIQTISFPNPVKSYTSDNCPKMETKDEMVFTHIMAPNKCIYLFTDGKDEHRHTTFGYDEVLIK